MSDLETIYARWLDGELNAEEIKSLKASGEWDELEELVKATNTISLSKYDKESAFEKLTHRNKSQKDTEQPEDPRIKISTVLSAAASLLLLLGALFFLREAAPIASANNGETLVHNFSDQSEVMLNDGSSISYNVEDWKTNRTVKLKGEAMFDVKSGRRFLVETDNGIVEVLGTSFNVRAWGDHFSVACYHGKVSVTSQGDNVLLTALESVKLENNELNKAEDITHEEPFWASGSSKFKDEKLENVFAELERQYDINIERPSSTKFFTGIFTHSDLDVALQQITKPMGLKYKTNQGRKRVIITN